MIQTDIAISTPVFWIIVAAAVLLLTVVKAASARRLIQAALNVSFLGAITGILLLPVLGAVLLLWLAMRTARKAWIPAGAVLAVLFLFHKSSLLKAVVDAPLVVQTLALVGFSFVVLRAVEFVRAMKEQRYPPPSLPELVNYLLPFHMLAAGPIQSYDDFVQGSGVWRRLTTRDALDGTGRIAHGLFKKFVLAYGLHALFLTDLTSEGLYFWFEVQILLIWLYLDFSAYSDIAVGIGRLTGIATPENFNRPLGARNLIEFWERWHISLSLFIRRNLFIPIQLWLMRRSKAPHPQLHAAIATFVAFTLAGAWHGLGAGWLLWGVIHACGLIAVRLWGYALQTRLSSDAMKRYRDNRLVGLVARIVTFEYVAFAFVPVFLWTGGF